jgi:hypothetical protein
VCQCPGPNLRHFQFSQWGIGPFDLFSPDREKFYIFLSRQGKILHFFVPRGKNFTFFLSREGKIQLKIFSFTHFLFSEFWNLKIPSAKLFRFSRNSNPKPKPKKNNFGFRISNVYVFVCNMYVNCHLGEPWSSQLERPGFDSRRLPALTLQDPHPRTCTGRNLTAWPGLTFYNLDLGRPGARPGLCRSLPHLSTIRTEKPV